MVYAVAACYFSVLFAAVGPVRHPTPGASVLQDVIQAAIESQAPYVKLPVGTHRSIPSLDKNLHIRIKDARDLIIDGDGTTLLATTLTRAINFQNSSNVTLRGLVVDYDPLPFTQGKVIYVRGGVHSNMDHGGMSVLRRLSCSVHVFAFLSTA